MAAARTQAHDLHCREEPILRPEDRRVFDPFFDQHGLSEEIFLFFESLVALSTDKEQFKFVKVLREDDLVGLAMFARIQGMPLSQSLNSRLRQNPAIAKLGSLLRSSVCFSMHSVSSPGLPGAFLYADSSLEGAVTEAVLSWMKQRRDADSAIIIDSAKKSDLYSRQSFLCFPFACDSWLDVARYGSLDDYLAIHRRTRKNISKLKRRKDVTLELLRGQVPEEVKRGMAECLLCSMRHSRILLPVQAFLNKNLFGTALFTSDRFIHFVIRIDGRIAGFSTRLSCNRNLIGIIGGYNREVSGSSPVYDLMIASTLDYCIQQGYDRLVYGIVDNYTKARLMDSFREQALYSYSRSPLAQLLMRRTYRFSSAYELSRLRQDLIQKRQATSSGAA
jgi:hypothetical protein